MPMAKLRGRAVCAFPVTHLSGESPATLTHTFRISGRLGRLELQAHFTDGAAESADHVIGLIKLRTMDHLLLADTPMPIGLAALGDFWLDGDAKYFVRGGTAAIKLINTSHRPVQIKVWWTAQLPVTLTRRPETARERATVRAFRKFQEWMTARTVPPIGPSATPPGVPIEPTQPA